MRELPNDQHITYQLQHRKCGKASCSTCRNGQGHGPYWYAYWREGSRLRSGYVGKASPYATEAQVPEEAQIHTALTGVPATHSQEHVGEAVFV